MSARWLSLLAACALVACGSDSSESAGDGGSAGTGGASGTGGAGGLPGTGGSPGTGGTPAGGGSAGTAGTDAGAGPPITTITAKHRAIPGKMFGGWGPHLGHLVRAGTTLWFVDDVCVPGSCDVLANTSLGYYELGASGWSEKTSVTLPGNVQQNTATIVNAAGTELQTFGIDVSASVVRECRYSPASGPLGCSALPFTLLPSSNYVGAAIAPNGSRLVWWTTVKDGGGGTFHYVVDYGGGWNGPRSGSVNGYNDASYVAIAFGGAKPSAFTMHAQLVSGLAPNWGFLGAVGYGDLTTTDAVSWANGLAAPGSDAVASTNDIWTDPGTGDTHLVARTAAGAAAYYHRPAGGSWSGPTFTLAATYRARFVVSGERLVLVYGPNAGGLAWRIASASDRPLGKPVAWSGLGEGSATLPGGFGAILAIYPESPAYQTGAAKGIHVALVGQGQENVVAHAAIEP